ncbi:MAG TPA: hypothetical protein VHS06_10325 [Chloroflexota bacterium]|nr:hypothetical protein [Chloroflexota bacterium]
MKNLQDLLKRLNPAIPRNWRLTLAGLMWTGVGIMLCSYALTWLRQSVLWIALVVGLLGVAISVLAHRLQFSRLAQKNIDRIRISPERACVFSFLAWKGYLIIAVMVTGGMLLRHSAIPRPYLAVIYTAIGGALLQASFSYYFYLARSWQVSAGTLPSRRR